MIEIQELIRTRYSVRDFLNEPIPDNVISDMKEAARLAPSFQNRQCWRYIFVDDPELIKDLSAKSGLVGKVNFFIKKAPLIVVACGDPAHSGRMNDQDYYLVDVAISFQQMMLAAWAHGIGSCWLAAFNEKSVRKILKIPRRIKVVAISPFGYPSKSKSIYSKVLTTLAGSKKRKEETKIFCRNQWTF